MKKFIFLAFIAWGLLLECQIPHASTLDEMGEPPARGASATDYLHNPHRLDLNTAHERLSVHTLPESLEDIFLLSIDGGGIRGIIPALILKELGRQTGSDIKKLIQADLLRLGVDVPTNDIPIIAPHLANMFHLMVGTSTGGIIALGLNVPTAKDSSTPRFRPEDLEKLYSEKGAKVFPPEEMEGLFNKVGQILAPKFSADGLINELQSYFGDTLLSQSITKVIITSYDLRSATPYFFNSDEAREKLSRNFPMRSVALATGSAPTYLPAAKVQDQENNEHLFIDGGVVLNNPSMIAYWHAQEYLRRGRTVYILSLGTARYKQYNLGNLEKQGLFNWARNITPVMMDGTSEATHWMLERMAVGTANKLIYMRIQPILPQEGSAMDNSDPNHIQYLRREADNAYTANETKLKELALALASSFLAKGFYINPDIISNVKQQLQAHQGVKLENIKLDPSQYKFLYWELGNLLSSYKGVQPTSLTLTISPNKLQSDQNIIPDIRMASLLLVKTAPAHCLSKLCLPGHQIFPEAAGIIARSMTGLRELDLSDNPLGPNGIKALAQHLTRLNSLNLASTAMEDSGAAELPLLTGLTSLQIGNLRGADPKHHNTFKSEATGAILVRLNRLQELSLARMRTFNTVYGICNYSSTNPSLTSLDLSHCGVGDPDVEEMVRFFKGKTNFRNLVLASNSITDDKASSLAALLSSSQSLTSLDLQSNKLQGQGAILIGESLRNNTALTNLILRRNGISDSAEFPSFLEILIANKGLQTLDLGQIALPDESSDKHYQRIEEALTKLKTARPRLKVHTNAVGAEGESQT